MKRLFQFFLLIGIAVVSYQVYRIYEDDLGLKTRLEQEAKTETDLANDLKRTQTQLEHRHLSDLQAKQALVDRLAHEIGEQLKRLQDLDSRLNDLSIKKNAPHMDEEIQEEIEYEQETIRVLQEDLQGARAAVSQQGAHLQTIGQARKYGTQAEIRSLRSRIQTQQNLMRNLRTSFRKPGTDYATASAKYQEAQAQFNLLKQALAQENQSDSGIRDAQSRTRGVLNASKKGIQEIQSDLKAETKRLADLKAEVHREDHADQAVIKSDEQAQNDYQTAKLKLQSLQDQFSKQSAVLERMKSTH